MEQYMGSMVVLPDEPAEIDAAAGDQGDELRLWLRLMTCSTLIEKEVRRRLRKDLDFTLPRFDLLAQLDKAGHGLVLGELSRRMMVTAGNLTSLVERMVESGHVTRTPLSTDRRVQIVALTPLGRKAFREMAGRHGGWIAALFADVPPRDRAVLMKHLGLLKHSVRKALVPDAA